MDQTLECNDLVCCVSDAWGVFMDGLEKSIQMLDEKLTEAEQMSAKVTGEWAVGWRSNMSWMTWRILYFPSVSRVIVPRPIRSD